MGVWCVLNKYAPRKNWRNKMKKLAIAAVFATAASTAFAGGMSEPMMVPEVVAEVVETASTGSSGAGLIVPLILVALIAAAAS